MTSEDRTADDQAGEDRAAEDRAAEDRAAEDRAAEDQGGPRPRDDRLQLDLTDPKAMRALAHPLRWALLEALGHAGTLTATQASEALGESPANCAFHLRTLAKYGFVREAGGGKGRERPWTRAHRSISLDTKGQADYQAELAAHALSQAYGERMIERIRYAYGNTSWPKGWGDAVISSDSVRFLTAAEAIGVS